MLIFGTGAVRLDYSSPCQLFAFDTMRRATLVVSRIYGLLKRTLSLSLKFWTPKMRDSRRFAHRMHRLKRMQVHTRTPKEFDTLAYAHLKISGPARCMLS